MSQRKDLKNSLYIESQVLRLHPMLVRMKKVIEMIKLYFNTSSFKMDILPIIRANAIVCTVVVAVFIAFTGCDKNEVDDIKVFRDDSLVVRQILDANNLSKIKVEDVTRKDPITGRIISFNLGNFSNIDTISDIFYEFPNVLHLHYNPGIYKKDTIRIVPNSIGNLSQLEFLNLSNNLIDSLPSSIGELKKLKQLHLFANPLREIPLSVCKLSSLEYFSFGQFDVKYGVVEYVDMNKTIELPESIGNLHNLKYLIVVNANLINVPSSIVKLKKLVHINLEGNFLMALPQSFDNLPNLKYLNLEKNLIDLTNDLPEYIGKLKVEPIEDSLYYRMFTYHSKGKKILRFTDSIFLRKSQMGGVYTLEDIDKRQ